MFALLSFSVIVLVLLALLIISYVKKVSFNELYCVEIVYELLDNNY